MALWKKRRIVVNVYPVYDLKIYTNEIRRTSDKDMNRMFEDNLTYEEQCTLEYLILKWLGYSTKTERKTAKMVHMNPLK